MEPEDFLSDLFGVLTDTNAKDDEKYPLWVRNIMKHLMETVFKKFEPLLQAGPNDPEMSGFAIGAARQMESIFEKLHDVIPKYDEKELEKFDLSFLENQFEEFEKDWKEFEEFEEKAEQEIRTASNHEASQFHRSMAEGLESLQDEEGNWKGTRLNTELLMQMLFLWPMIEEQVQTRRQLYQIARPRSAMARMTNAQARD